MQNCMKINRVVQELWAFSLIVHGGRADERTHIVIIVHT